MYEDANGDVVPVPDSELVDGELKPGSTIQLFTNADALAELNSMADESLFVDIGLGFRLDEDGEVIDSTAFDSALSGLNFLGFGTDKDGDPKNIVSIMLKISDIFGEYEHNPDDSTKSTWGPSGDYEDACRLTSKFTDAQAYLSEQHTSLSAQGTYLETNQKRLDDTFFNLNSERSTIEDCDPADAITEYIAVNTCYQAALQVGTNVIPQSLMDYLR